MQRRTAPVGGEPKALDRNEPIAGYVHDWQRSRLAIGAGVVESREPPWDKQVGSWGTFALNVVTGYSAGDQHPGSPMLDRAPYGTSAAKHNARVRAYFVAAGLPAFHVGSVRRWPPADPASWSDPAAPAERRPYYTHLGRAVRGVPVVESFAWARVNEDDVVVCEGVYWPPIPRRVLDEAAALLARLSDDGALEKFRRALPAGPGRVAVHHSSFAAFPEDAKQSPAFEAHALFDVTTEGGYGRGAVRHFDAAGAEVTLSQEGSHGPRGLA